MPYKRSEYFTKPRLHGKDILWRYMHIDKLLAMLKDKSLYFPNIYSFNDEYEGTLPRLTRIEVNNRSLLDDNTPINHKDVINTRKDIIKEYPNETSRKEIFSLYTFEDLLKVFSNYFMFCNCWFLRDEESHSMWAEYGDKSPRAIAIQTTVKHLKGCMKNTRFKIHIGKINYRDYDEDIIEEYKGFESIDLTTPDNVLKLFYAPIMYKRSMFKDEREVRAIISFESVCNRFLGCKKCLGCITDNECEIDLYRLYTSDIPLLQDNSFDITKIRTSSEKTKLDMIKEIGNSVNVDINIIALIQKIVISPYANPYYEKPLKELLQYYGIDPNKVEKSKLTKQNGSIIKMEEA